MTLFTIENIDITNRRKLFRLLDVDFMATPYTWLNPLLMSVAGIVVALMFAPVDSLGSQILVGIGYGMLLVLSMFCHGLGHIISSRMVHAPVKTIVLTATVEVTLYEDETEQPSRVHVGRSLGGPLFNLLLGVIGTALFVFGLQSHFLLFFGLVNLLIGLVTLLPIPSIDGAVIWRELWHWHG